MHRFFLPLDAHRIRDVLRLKPGSQFELADGSGKVFQAEIDKLGAGIIEYKILSNLTADPEPSIKVTLAQALPKAAKMDFIIEKAVELGVTRFIPMTTERTIGKFNKLERWQKIAKSAAEQSGRAIIPEISQLAKFEEVLKKRKSFDLALIPWEEETIVSLKSVLTTHPPFHLSTILVAIGPEGGFSRIEVKQAKEAGFISVSLGKRILRTETAGMAVLASLIYALDS